MAEEHPTFGGNSAAYNQIIGGAKVNESVEFTMFGYKSDLGVEFVAYQLIRQWEKSESSPLLQGSFSSLGLSNRGHPHTYNLIQCLYLSDNSNANTMS